MLSFERKLIKAKHCYISSPFIRAIHLILQPYGSCIICNCAWQFSQLLGCEQTSKFVQLFLETLNFESNFSDLAEMNFSLIPIIFCKHLLEQVCCNLLAQSG